ncbi:MAG TPA: AAA family ATPase [Capsulimonadaceae bacterium]|jgi:5-methylcytosine-specific restriction protein B
MSIHPVVLEELKAAHDRLNRDNQLPSRDQLNRYYDRFKAHFGPEQIGRLDGDELLERTMLSASNKNCVQYWLEFKNDEEFPDIFGGIAGGSSLKYGIFFSASGKWTQGSSRSIVEATKSEALDYARAQRDQLILACDVLSKYQDATEDAQFRELQDRLIAAAPKLAPTSWGHKYFALLFPDLLETFHTQFFQNFQLIRSLEVPAAGTERYVNSGRFRAIARELDVSLYSACKVLVERNGRSTYTYWRVGTTDWSGTSEWPSMLGNGCASIGWHPIGDLSDVASEPDEKKRREEIKSRLQDTNRADWFEKYEKNNSVASNTAHQIDDFIAGTHVGDIMVAMDGTAVIGIGRVTGAYRYSASEKFPHRIPVEWLSSDRWYMNPPEGKLSTFRSIGKFPSNTVEIERRMVKASPIIAPAPSPPPLSTLQVTTPPLVQLPPPPPLKGHPARVQAILARKGQVILYGPPGTGKTYWAEIAARELAARSWFSKEAKLLDDQERVQVDGTAVRICSFHAAYGYEDFLESYRPREVSGSMLFAERDGIFKQLCREAGQNPQKSYFLIIDEINRGDIPRIFGELLTVLEKNKRGKSVVLPLSGKPFSVPNNVFIIGTMNTADRSIALLDAALRRRFGFIELLPETMHFADVVLGGLPLKPWLDSLNGGILQHLGRDGRNLQIGHAYFLTDKGPVATLSEFAQIIRDDIIPLLEEYTYEDYAILEKMLGTYLVDLKRQRINDDLFAPDRSEDLAKALISPYPEIATSYAAIAAPADEKDENVETDSEYEVEEGTVSEADSQ